jgi:microcystin-dependent protein
MSDPFIGQLMLFAGNFAPQGWALCDGQLLAISQNQALFSILGTTYGGNGTTNFALPDLRGRAPIHMGQGPGLSNYVEGEVGGSEGVTLTVGEMPSHNHLVRAEGGDGNTSSPSGSIPSKTTSSNYSNAAPSVQMNPGMIDAAGGNQPHENRAPFLVLNWCIALIGIFPSRG